MQQEQVPRNTTIVVAASASSSSLLLCNPWRSLYAKIVPGHGSPVVAEIAGNDQFYLFRREALSLQFPAKFLGMVGPQAMGAGVAIAE